MGARHTRRMTAPPRPRILRRAVEVPEALVDEMLLDMAKRMTATPEARRCDGLSFTFAVSDRSIPTSRYSVGARGRVSLTRGDDRVSTFTFTGETDTFDAVLRGMESAIAALIRRRIRLHGSFSHVRSLLRMMPAVTRAYNDARAALIERHQERYDFRF